MPGSAVKFVSTCLWLFALLEYGWGQDVANDSQVNGVRVPATGSTVLTKTGNIRYRRASTSGMTSFCVTPPQPANGEYKLDQYSCDGLDDCGVDVGVPLEPGSMLVYRCSPGYRVDGRSEVNCRVRGEWSPIPECVEVKCDSLNSASTMVSCMYLEREINCHSPVPRGTRAEVTCRRGYRRDEDSVLTSRRGVVYCNVNGKWDPQPIRCIPACGRAIIDQQPYVYGGRRAKVGEFPWHASLFEQRNSSSRSMKVFLCGATVIHTNLLLTAAHCVHDEGTRTTTDPGKLLVITGNTFRDYDFPIHNSNLVRKAAVKNVYASCDYHGLTGNYAGDIALLELQQPFELSDILLPACLDYSEYSEEFLESGAYGRVAGFGRTKTGTTSGILQTITVPYVSYSQCRASNNATGTVPFISTDKFCAGYSNGSAVCEGDSGGGLVFGKDKLWYVMGIVSVGLGVDTRNGERKCDEFSYSLYTRVSSYIRWIQEVLLYVEHKQRYPSCNHDERMSSETFAPHTLMSQLTMASKLARTFMTSPLQHSCSAPPQPANGSWKLHQKDCEDGMDCKVLPGAKVKTGSRLIYRCEPSFTIKGETTSSYCLANGEWTPFPTCTGNSCDLTNGSLGACTLLKDCQSLLEEPEAGRLPIQNCGFSGSDSRVCCPIRSPTVITPPRAPRPTSRVEVPPPPANDPPSRAHNSPPLGYNPSPAANNPPPWDYNPSPWDYNPSSWAHSLPPWSDNPSPWYYNPSFWAHSLPPWSYNPSPWAYNPSSWAHHSPPWGYNPSPWAYNPSSWAHHSAPWGYNPSPWAGSGFWVYVPTPASDHVPFLGVVSPAEDYDPSPLAGDPPPPKNSASKGVPTSGVSLPPNDYKWNPPVIPPAGDPSPWATPPPRPSIHQVSGIFPAVATSRPPHTDDPVDNGNSCLTPPQPANGQYKLDRYSCNDIVDCEVGVGSPLEPGSTLVYRCNPGYKATGNHDVHCRVRGKWSSIPECVEMTCESLNSSSTMVTCTRSGKSVNCDHPVPISTVAYVSCRPGYKMDSTFITARRPAVYCSADGWDPLPIRCVPDLLKKSMS